MRSEIEIAQLSLYEIRVFLIIVPFYYKTVDFTPFFQNEIDFYSLSTYSIIIYEIRITWVHYQEFAKIP
jgi:hypothetical protein